jgi:hypothetical protein
MCGGRGRGATAAAVTSASGQPWCHSKETCSHGGGPPLVLGTVLGGGQAKRCCNCRTLLLAVLAITCARLTRTQHAASGCSECGCRALLHIPRPVSVPMAVPH